jgi:hypothetical protein
MFRPNRCPNHPRNRDIAHVHLVCPVCEESSLCFLIGKPERATRDCPGTGPTDEGFTALCGHDPSEADFQILFDAAIEETTHDDRD